MGLPVHALRDQVAGHMVRLFHQTGGMGLLARERFRRLAYGFPHDVAEWTPEQCVQGLRLIEQAARDTGMHFIRDIRTGWQHVN